MTAFFQQLDVCLSDYFCGHRNFVFAVPVTCETTFNDIIEALESEYIEFNEYTGFNETDFNEALESLKSDLSEILNTVPESCKYIETDLDGDSESVYMYFTIIAEDTDQ